MSIAINQSRCVGCGRCSQVCPGTLIGMDSDGKACMLYAVKVHVRKRLHGK